jgi:hypothetical protein
MSKSKAEEIIAMLWTILWAILFVNQSPEWMIWISGIKAIGDHLCAVRYAIREIRSENTPDQERKSPASDGFKFNNTNEL